MLSGSVRDGSVGISLAAKRACAVDAAKELATQEIKEILDRDDAELVFSLLVRLREHERERVGGCLRVVSG